MWEGLKYWMYKSFTLPQFDYTDIVQDNSLGTFSDVLKNLRLEAVRIIVGAVRRAKPRKLV